MKRIIIALCTGSLMLTPPPAMDGTKGTILVTSEAAQAAAEGQGEEQISQPPAPESAEEQISQPPASGPGPAEGQASQPASGPEISAPSAVLMEASTGKVIYEKDADKQRRPASITKIMTLWLPMWARKN